MLLTIPPARTAFEAQRAAEIQQADAALQRERRLWYLAAIGCLLGGAGIASVGFHVVTPRSGAIWIGLGTLIGEVGPMAIILIALHREES